MKAGEPRIHQGVQCSQVNRGNHSSGTYGQGQDGSKVAKVPVLGNSGSKGRDMGSGYP